ncbi:hypothetical protein [Cryptosporidium parvum Iowa II]|uniref:Uncharacterized protein n=2 Tax=Cryptosporidium parvum TaxID=5807 RepID=Q5CTN2_CRYPI|nr:hypothetical protein [Cryptosporidium parvum Iowa II]EAK88765.1 hypothetical protein cgd2_2330 [Cryptosporidium parvum Iowa II]QOY43000.1 Uncharacterized protein CPATCC_0028480 [Cryptosporidium parvum]WKS76529.1 hypothetical protein CPCDC_2g2330 [Cryptosporidium sp. 43IA8]WRK31022.1 Uncharacterized protein cpbgf_2002330 [Cryptosporidium parvum]|eukprot:QOY43000.1 hypothetical protein CPATCC_000699 [Cryptosporidium parvum]
MSDHSSLFSLSKISISDLLMLKEKKCENKIENAKFITKPSNLEDIFTEDFKQKMERNKICLSVNAQGDVLTHFPLFLNEPFTSNENNKSLSARIDTKKENLHLNQTNNSAISKKRSKINEIIETNIGDHLIYEMKINKNRFARKELTSTKLIWNSIQENIKSIISSTE